MAQENRQFPDPFQRPVADVDRTSRDIVIVGAGPAGSTCARILAEAGEDVLLIDKDEFPRHKVCGDLLIADALQALKDLGMYDRIASVAYQSDSIEVSSPSGVRFRVPGEYLGLSRKRLDYELYRHAAAAGAEAVRGAVAGIESGALGERAVLRMADSEQTLSARVVILATGGVVDLAHDAGIVASKLPSAIAMRCYVRSPLLRANSIIAYDQSIVPGYGWVIPLGSNGNGHCVYNIGCGTSYRHLQNGRHNLKKTMKRFIREFEPAREVMEGAQIISPVEGAALRCGLDYNGAPYQGNVVAIGETIGATYPFTGEGIGKAMETGALAAEHVASFLRDSDERHLTEYRAALEGLRERYEGYMIAERWLSNPRLNDFVARRVVKSAYLQAKLRAFMAETDDPRSLFSVASLVKSYFV